MKKTNPEILNDVLHFCEENFVECNNGDDPRFIMSCDDCKSITAYDMGYEDGKKDAEIEWNKYPVEMPDGIWGMYIVKVKSWLSGCVEVRILPWSNKRFFGLGQDKPLEWADIPEKWRKIEPFEGECK